MSQNQRLVEYFVSEFYRNKTIALEHITSSSFVFIIQSGSEQSFAEYASRMNILSDSCRLELADPVSEDDIMFVSTFSMTVPSPNKEDLVATGTNKFFVENDLLCKVIVEYDTSADEYKRIQERLAENHSKIDPVHEDLSDDIDFV